MAGPDIPNCTRDLRLPVISKEDATELEELILELEAKAPTLSQFVLPGGSQAAATLRLAGSVSRRLERRLVALSQEQAASAEQLAHLNRLADVLSVLARYTQHVSGGKNEVWTDPKQEQAPANIY